MTAAAISRAAIAAVSCIQEGRGVPLLYGKAYRHRIVRLPILKDRIHWSSGPALLAS